MKRLFLYRYLLPVVYILFITSFLFVLSSCEKDIKATAALSSADLSQQMGNSIEKVVTEGFDTGGLVAWYSFDNGSLRDLSTYHNKIIFNNAQLAADRNGVANNAYQFNGTTNYMEVKNSPSLNPKSEVTLFTIVKFDDFYAGKCHGNRILNKGYPDGVPGFYTVGSSDDYYTHGFNCSQDVDKAHETFEIGFNNTGGGDTTAFIQTGHWYHIVYTYGKGIANLYIDGKLVKSAPETVAPAENSSDLFFGTTAKPSVQYPYWFAGSIDQVAIFNRALNATQVAKLSAY